MSLSTIQQKATLRALVLTGVLVLAFTFVPVALAQEGEEIRSPDECAACHPEAYESWETTLHANTSTRPEFISAWADAGRPAYCRQCHGTGYDPASGEFILEDVTCQSCHWALEDESHPGGQMMVDTSAELCGDCHSGVHSPTYEEWLLSDHGTMNIDCLTCHDPHNDAMRADNVNQLCSRCHEEATTGTAHNIEGMECSFCHMYGAQELSGPGESSQGTGHTFNIPPDVCASCHGMTHTLTVDEVAEDEETGAEVAEAEAGSATEPQASADPEELETTIAELEARARDNLDLGLAGGGLGGLLLGGAMVWFIRRGKSA
jgi:predicted CXXCH cytochrome family protein